MRRGRPVLHRGGTDPRGHHGSDRDDHRHGERAGSGPFSIAIAFSEPVTGFALEDLVVGNGSAVSGPFSITVTFSEPVTGFELPDLVVGNGSASELQGNEASYAATVTPAASGAVTVDIAAGAAEDGAGNPSAAADQFSAIASEKHFRVR